MQRTIGVSWSLGTAALPAVVMVTVCVICFSQYFALGKKEEGEEEEEKKEEGGRIERRRKSKEEEQKKGQQEKPKSNTR